MTAVAKLRSSRGQKLGEELAIELLVVGFSAPSSETHKPSINNMLLADARRANARLRNHHMINVSNDEDRALLMFPSAQSRQVHACRVDTLGEVTDVEQLALLSHNSPVLKAAVKFATSLATDYSTKVFELHRAKGGRVDRLRAARLDGRRHAYPKNEAEAGETVFARPASKQLYEKEAGVSNAEVEPLVPMPMAPRRSASRMAPSEAEASSTTAMAGVYFGLECAGFPPFIDED